MDRREFSRNSVLLGLGAAAGLTHHVQAQSETEDGDYYAEPVKKLPIRRVDAVIAGGGTAGVVAALAAARQGASTMLIEIKGYTGGTCGIPYKALCVKGIENLLVSGMMITSDRRAHMSTRNTVCCMGQGQAAGTAAALCAAKHLGTRDLKYAQLRVALLKKDAYLET